MPTERSVMTFFCSMGCPTDSLGGWSATRGCDQGSEGSSAAKAWDGCGGGGSGVGGGGRKPKHHWVLWRRRCWRERRRRRRQAQVWAGGRGVPKQQQRRWCQWGRRRRVSPRGACWLPAALHVHGGRRLRGTPGERKCGDPAFFFVASLPVRPCGPYRLTCTRFSFVAVACVVLP